MRIILSGDTFLPISIIVRRTTEFGKITVSQSIPLLCATRGDKCQDCLMWLHYSVTFHVPKYEGDMGGFLPRTPEPPTLDELIAKERKKREQRQFTVRKSPEGHDILDFTEGLKSMRVKATRPWVDPYSDSEDNEASESRNLGRGPVIRKMDSRTTSDLLRKCPLSDAESDGSDVEDHPVKYEYQL